MKIYDTIFEQTSSDVYSAMLGYLDLYGDDIVKKLGDPIKMIPAKKEVMVYCEDLRDGKTPSNLLTKESLSLFNTTMKITRESKDIQNLIERGRNIRHT